MGPDHLVLATPDLALGVKQVEVLLGVRPEIGGHQTRAPGRTMQQLRALGIRMAVARGAKPALVATVDGPSGRVELR